ncbi:MAG: hypothetical protein ACEB74_08655 [Desulfovibrio aminophilus]
MIDRIIPLGHGWKVYTNEEQALVKDLTPLQRNLASRGKLALSAHNEGL